MRRLLSTKLLSAGHRLQLESAGWAVDQYNAISIELITTPVAPEADWLVFTSKNAVKGFLKSFSHYDFSSLLCLCVGDRTAEMLKEHGLTVLHAAPAAEELAGQIRQWYSGKSFVYYCGNRRLDRIPATLDELGVKWQEGVVYRTHLNYRKVSPEPEAILFFSPSGIESYLGRNEMGAAWGLCIGRTTAACLKKYTDRVLFPERPDIDSLIDLATMQTHLLNP